MGIEGLYKKKVESKERSIKSRWNISYHSSVLETLGCYYSVLIYSFVCLDIKSYILMN